MLWAGRPSSLGKLVQVVLNMPGDVPGAFGQLLELFWRGCRFGPASCFGGTHVLKPADGVIDGRLGHGLVLVRTLDREFRPQVISPWGVAI